MAEALDESASIFDKVDLECMLEFETQIFLDIVQSDGLIVAAKGLNLDLVLLNIFKVYCDPGNLVLVLNASETEEKYFIDKLNNQHVHRTTCTTNVTEREDVYLSGGIQFITTRILVVDMLKKRLPIEKITGFIILRAHKVIESCQEAFVMRLYRQNNKTGFIKAFSNSVQSFTMGFCHVERVMRTLFVKDLYIWPRFHSLVIQSMKKHEPQVVELQVPISPNMSKIQTYILELMNLTVKELKRFNKTIELQEITVENCLIKKFHKVLQLQLDAIWHQLSENSRQLVADLKTLRHLIITMLYSDPVTFYSVLSGYRTMEYAQQATWVLQEPAEMLFTQANQILFTGNKELNPEFCPKWETLLEILNVEIPDEIKKSKNDQDNKIVILCSDKRTCYQLNRILKYGPKQFLFLTSLERGIKFKKIADSFKGSEKMVEPQPESKKRQKLDTTASSKSEQNEETVSEEEFKSSYILTMSQMSFCEEKNASTSKDSMNSSQYIFEPFEELENLNVTQIIESLSAPTILIQTFKGLEGTINLQRSLEEIKPSFIIMYHSNITAIREIEMYEAHRQRTTPLKVYFLIHGETVEEQSYLTSMRREKEAFELLIQTKSTMVVPEDQDGKTDICTTLERDLKSPTKNTRQGAGISEEVPRKFIVVDVREFRSELPPLIHKRGIDIEPFQITVGDYVLTPEICVERKSFSDLIGSLNSGRLYQQCCQMTRYYAKPMLLIEFDQNKPFSWQNNYILSTDSNSFHIQEKLLLLTIHFPKLKIIWSPSPYATAQLFEELKEGKEQPNIATCIGSDEDMDVIETKYNTSVYDFVQKLPGINSKNIDNFLRHSNTFQSVINKTEDELKELLGNRNDAKALYSAIHEDHSPKEELEKRQKAKSKPKFNFPKKSRGK